jgi:uncharacterized protein YbjT (DUF2867 family)
MYAILGATGHVGSVITETLLAKGEKVRVIARSADKLQAFAAKGAEVHAGDASDTAFLTKAFTGAKAAFIMIPSTMTTPDIGKLQDTIGSSIVEALKVSGVQYVVNLSSVGAHTEEKTGVVAGLARQERRLNALGIHMLHLRPGYFYENLLGNIGMIKGMGINGSALEGGKALEMVATKDIGVYAAERLLALDFTGSSIEPILGPKDQTMNDVTAALGKAIGKPDLAYIQFPYDQARQGMVQSGFSESVADGYISLSTGMNEGVFSTEKRDARATTPTTIEDFAKTVFAPAFNA